GARVKGERGEPRISGLGGLPSTAGFPCPDTHPDPDRRNGGAPGTAPAGPDRASTLKGQFLACQGCRSSPAGDRWGDALPGRVGAMVQAGAASQAATTRLRGARPLANLCHAAAPSPDSPSRLRRTLPPVPRRATSVRPRLDPRGAGIDSFLQMIRNRAL